MTHHDLRPQRFFAPGGFEVVEVGLDELPKLQRFFEANPDYFLTVNGEVAGPDVAHETVFSPLPDGWPFTKLWVLGVVGEGDACYAMAHVVSDLLAIGVWHIGLFIVASERHGDGTARALLRCLENWAAANGAEWLRLGVVAGNARAERFWETSGFVEVRTREGLVMGRKVNTIRAMAKPLAGGSLAAYRSRVVRDDPRSP